MVEFVVVIASIVMGQTALVATACDRIAATRWEGNGFIVCLCGVGALVAVVALVVVLEAAAVVVGLVVAALTAAAVVVGLVVVLVSGSTNSGIISIRRAGLKRESR